MAVSIRRESKSGPSAGRAEAKSRQESWRVERVEIGGATALHRRPTQNPLLDDAAI
jgi:hypothetical protein